MITATQNSTAGEQLIPSGFLSERTWFPPFYSVVDNYKTIMLSCQEIFISYFKFSDHGNTETNVKGSYQKSE
jgi:hypothetical protein